MSTEQKVESKDLKCYGVGNVLKKPLGLGSGVNVTLYIDSETGKPDRIACPFAIGSPGLISCAAKDPRVIDKFEKGIDGSLADTPLCYQLHPRRINS